MLTLMRIKIKKINKGGDLGPRFGNLSVNWAKIPKTPTPTVNMNRNGDGCPTAIMSLSFHNDHAPSFEDEADLDDYINRIMADVDAAMVAWVDGVYDGPTVEETPTPIINEDIKVAIQFLSASEPQVSTFGGTKVVYTAAELGIPDGYKDDILKVPKLATIPAADIAFDVDEYHRRVDGKWELVVPSTKPPTSLSLAETAHGP